MKGFIHNPIACLLFLGATLLASAPRAEALTIDDFLDGGGLANAAIATSPGNPPSEKLISSTSAIGGTRALSVGQIGNVSGGSANVYTNGNFFHNQDSGVQATSFVRWDGDNTVSNFSYNGLHLVNFLSDSGTKILLKVISFDLPKGVPVDIALTLYDGSAAPAGSKYSRVTVHLDKALTNFTLEIPYTIFNTQGAGAITGPSGTLTTSTSFGGNGKADLTKIGAIEFYTNGQPDDADIGVDYLRTDGICSAVPGSDGKVIDDCGVCRGQPNYQVAKDDCGVCAGQPGYNNSKDECGVCFGGNAGKDSCGVCFGNNAAKDSCGVCFGNNAAKDTCGYCTNLPGYMSQKDSCGLCPSAPNYNNSKDPCGVCGGNGSSCADCSGTPNGGKTFDVCHVCGGNGTTCLDCKGVPFGTAGYDACNICGGNGQSCLDCAGTPFGTAVLDSCGVCAGNNLTKDSCGSCTNAPNYMSQKDNCGLCPSTPNYNNSKDQCGVCGGNGTTCADCSGTPNGGKVVDVCGVCGGTGTTCLDCSGKPFGTARLDACGTCGGTVADATQCPRDQSCQIVQATSDILTFEKRLVTQAKDITKKFNDEAKRADRNKCGLNYKSSKSRVTNALATITQKGTDIFAKGVEVCGESCVTVSFADQVTALKPTFNIIKSEATSIANKVKGCYKRKRIVVAGGTPGVTTTIKSVDTELKQLIQDCKNKQVCPH